MKKSNVIGILSVFCVIAFVLFYNHSIKQSSPHTNTTAKMKDSPKDFQVRDLQKSQVEPYQRPQLQRPISVRELQFLTQDFTDEKTLLEVAKTIRELPSAVQTDLDFFEKEEWNLNQLPSTQAEYVLFINEAKIKSLDMLVNSAIKEDLSGIRLASASFVSFAVLGALRFKGYNSEGQLGLELPSDFMAQNRRSRKKVFHKEKKREIANEQAETGEVDVAADVEGDAKEIGLDREEEFSLEALFAEKLEQSAFFADVDNPGTRSSRYWGGEKNLFDGPTEAVDYLVNALANLDIFYSSPTSMHETNLETVKETIQDARRSPAEYGLTGRRSTNPLDDITDLEYEVFAEAVTRKVALHHALLGAGFTTVLGRGIVDKIQNARVFAAGILVTIGVESVFAAMGTYWGNMRLIMLHRYYSYIRDASEYFEKNDRDFVMGDIDPFNPDVVYFSETTRIELNKSWLWGFSFGTIINKTVTQPALRRISSTILTWGLEMAVSNGILLRLTGKSIYFFSLLMQTSPGELIGRLWALPLSSVTWATRVIDFFKKAFSVTPASIALYVADFTFTSAAIYSAIHTKLYSSTIMLDRIYYSPETAIYLSQMQHWHQGRPFLESTRELFYPLCTYLATNDLNVQRMIRHSSKELDSRIDTLFANRRQNCKELIAAFEGIDVEDVESALESLESQELTPIGTREALNGERLVLEEEIGEVLVKMHHIYPEFYRIIWVSALQAIFEPRHLPDRFFGIKNMIISNEGGDEFRDFDSYVNFSTHKLAEKINTHRFEYILEKLAHRARELKIEAGRASANDSLNLTEAFVIYWKFHMANLKSVNAEFLDLLDEEEKGFWRMLWDGLKSSVNNIKWIVNRWTNDPYKLTYMYSLENQIVDMDGNIIKEPNCWFNGMWCD